MIAEVLPYCSNIMASPIDKKAVHLVNEEHRREKLRRLGAEVGERVPWLAFWLAPHRDRKAYFSFASRFRPPRSLLQSLRQCE